MILLRMTSCQESFKIKSYVNLGKLTHLPRQMGKCVSKEILFFFCVCFCVQEVIEAIAECAFKTSPFPVILSFENHVDS